jgi:hypothetical protein
MRTFRLALLVTASIASLGALATPENYSIDLKTETSGPECRRDRDARAPGRGRRHQPTSDSACAASWTSKAESSRRGGRSLAGAGHRGARESSRERSRYRKLAVQVSCGTLSADEQIPPVR